jgi:hypothetical protein
MSEEWYHSSIHSGELSDYSPHAVRAFRDWLRAKYRVADALRRAWNDPRADFDSAVVPSQAAREAGRNERTFRDPATQMPVIDWYLFYNDLVPDTMEVFLNCFHLADTQRELVRRKVLNCNCTVLWCYASGRFNGAETSVEAMRELTGLRIRPDHGGARLRLRITLTDEGQSLLEHGMEVATLAAESTTRQRLESRAPAPVVIGHEHVWAQLISVEDPEATALGRLEGRTEVLLAHKPMRGWTSVFTANPVLPAAMLRALACQAGVHLYHRRDDTFYASRSYVCLNADGAGERTLRFPRPADLFHPFTGQRLARRVTEFSHRFADKETFLARYAT